MRTAILIVTAQAINAIDYADDLFESAQWRVHLVLRDLRMIICAVREEFY